jgi:hypothetical protein
MIVAMQTKKEKSDQKSNDAITPKSKGSNDKTQQNKNFLNP